MTRYKRKYVPNRYKRPNNKITQAVFRYYDNTTIENKVDSSNNGVAVAGHVAHSLSDCLGSSPYINLFAQYRVNRVKIQFIPETGNRMTLSQTSATTALAAGRPLFCSVPNKVATSFPQDMEQALSTSSCKYHPMGRYHSRMFTPVTFDQVYRSESSSQPAFNPEYKQWISTNMPNIAQHGLSWVISASDGHIPSGFYKYRIITTMYCQFKNRRVNTENASTTTAA
jgi:hypothetical protein